MKRITLNKYVKIALILSTLVAFLLILCGGFATQRQTLANEQIFWSTNRVVNGIGVLFLLGGWACWEYYASAKKRIIWVGITAIVLTFIATIMINGVIGLIGGFLALGIISTIFTISIKPSLLVRSK